jgi:hypothetical protein
MTEKREKGLKKEWLWLAKPALAWHTGLSGGAPDNVRCPGWPDGEVAALGNLHGDVAINHRTVRWCTGLSGESSAPVPKSSATNLSLSGKAEGAAAKIHRTVRWANGARGQWSPARSTGDTWLSQWLDDRTGLSGVHRTMSGVPTDPKIEQSASLEKERDCAPDCYSSCPVVHRTVRRTTRQKTRIAFHVDLQRLLPALGL